MKDLEKQLEQWVADGTWDRLNSACKTRAPINIRRSTGEIVRGVIVEVNVRCIVAWGEGAETYEYRHGRYHFSAGVQHKKPLTEDVLMWNPELNGGRT